MAQPAGDSGATGSTGATGAAAPKEASPAPAERSTDTRAVRSLGPNCAGLSDRQTERACRDGHAVGHSQEATGLDDGGKTDDQAS